MFRVNRTFFKRVWLLAFLRPYTLKPILGLPQSQIRSSERDKERAMYSPMARCLLPSMRTSAPAMGFFWLSTTVPLSNRNPAVGAVDLAGAATGRCDATTTGGGGALGRSNKAAKSGINSNAAHTAKAVPQRAGAFVRLVCTEKAGGQTTLNPPRW